MRPSFLAYTLLAVVPRALSAPLFGLSNLFGGDDDSAATTSPVSNATVDSDLTRPAQFARLAYCSAGAVQALNCGGPCTDLGGNIQVTQIGGDNGKIPMYFIATDADQDQVVVSHQGTDPSNILSIANDAEFGLVDLNATRFTSAVGKNIQVHDGFQQTFERTADGLLAGVQQALATTGSKKVLVTGHSLGAAIATLDAMMLKQELDPSVQIQTTVFGLPRVGNQAWADFVDNGLDNTLQFVTNQNDPVPTVPPTFLDFVHPQGEIHIQAVDLAGQATAIISCIGQDNENCATGNNVLDASIPNHLGPYFNDISFGGSACPA